MNQTIFENDPRLLQMSKEKKQFILEFAQVKKPDNTKEAMPFLIKYINLAKTRKLQFTREETELLAEILIQNLAPGEQAQVQKVLKLLYRS